jgi:hypothetical protein
MLELNYVYIYIKTLKEAICEITNYKDVVIFDIKQMYNYIFFDIENIGEQEIDIIEIVLPFKKGSISEPNLKHNAKECPISSHNDFVKLEYKMANPLKKDTDFKDFKVKIGFKITFLNLKKKLTQKELTLHIFNLNVLEKSCRPKISHEYFPSICPKTMEIYVVLPKSLRKDNFYPRAEHSNDSDKRKLKAEFTELFDNKNMLNEEIFDKVFKWTNYQLTDLKDKFFPTSDGGRIVSIEYSKNDNVQMFGIECNRVTKISLIIAIISLFFAIISLPLTISWYKEFMVSKLFFAIISLIL